MSYEHDLLRSPGHMRSSYLDDILIYSDNLDKHQCHVREVLLRLQNNKLYARGDKCFFHQDTVEYLGYILSPNGLTMDINKVKTILDWPKHEKSGIFNPSLDLPTSTGVPSLTSPISQFH
jgi:Reverse transcriptase (RNA-dependent DNA polymerase)